MSEPPHPELRASDADRERVAEVLRQAAGNGQLEIDELGERLEQTYGARTRGELETLTADLDRAEAAPSTGSFVVRRGAGGARWLLAIMGGCERKGRWRLAERSTALNVMGGSDLDLSQVELAADSVQLTVISIMGGSEIRVPEGLRVEVSDVAFMGGNDVDIGDDHAAADAPVLRLRLFSLMGGSDVRRGPRPPRRKHLTHGG